MFQIINELIAAPRNEHFSMDKGSFGLKCFKLKWLCIIRCENDNFQPIVQFIHLHPHKCSKLWSKCSKCSCKIAMKMFYCVFQPLHIKHSIHILQPEYSSFMTWQSPEPQFIVAALCEFFPSSSSDSRLNIFAWVNHLIHLLWYLPFRFSFMSWCVSKSQQFVDLFAFTTEL